MNKKTKRFVRIFFAFCLFASTFSQITYAGTPRNVQTATTNEIIAFAEAHGLAVIWNYSPAGRQSVPSIQSAQEAETLLLKLQQQTAKNQFLNAHAQITNYNSEPYAIVNRTHFQYIDARMGVFGNTGLNVAINYTVDVKSKPYNTEQDLPPALRAGAVVLSVNSLTSTMDGFHFLVHWVQDGWNYNIVNNGQGFNYFFWGRAILGVEWNGLPIGLVENYSFASGVAV